MKSSFVKSFFCAVLTFCFLALCMIPINAMPGKDDLGKIPLYKGKITVDGKVDEAYTLGLKLDIDKVYTDATKSASTATLKLLHDGAHIYAVVELKSGYPLTDINPTYDNNTAWNTTSCQLAIDWANKGENAYDMMALYNNHVFGARAAAEKETEYLVAYASSVDYAAKTAVFEYELNFMEGAKTGSAVGLCGMVNSDSDMGPSKTAKRTIISTQPGVAVSKYNLYGNVTLSADEVKLPTAEAKQSQTAVSAAAKTADMTGLLLAAALSMTAAAFTAKKRG